MVEGGEGEGRRPFREMQIQLDLNENVPLVTGIRSPCSYSDSGNGP